MRSSMGVGKKNESAIGVLDVDIACGMVLVSWRGFEESSFSIENTNREEVVMEEFSG